MEMTFEQAMRPGMLQAFANRRGSGYMMRSEKRGGSYSSGPSRKPPRRRKAGFVYIFFTILISLILWPVGMVMLWRRKVRFQAGTKLLISLLTLCLSVFLIVFALMVPVDNPEYTAFQDRANDWLDKAAVDVAAAGDATYKKCSETWQIMGDFAKASSDYALVTTADAVDKGVELAGTARDAIVGLFHKEPAPTEAPAEPTEAPEATEAPENTEQPVVIDEPLETEAPAETDALDIHLPEATPDEADAQALEEGALLADGSFVAGAAPVEATEEATEAPTETPTEEPTQAPTQAPAEEPTEEPTEVPTEKPTEAPTEVPAPTEESVASPIELLTPEPSQSAEPEATAAPTERPLGAVKPAGEATVYYYTDGSKGFHRGPRLHGMGGAPAHTLAEAFADGKTPCASCGMPEESILSEENVAWVDGKNVIHTTDECPSFSGDWRLIPLAEAKEAGYDACPDCLATDYVQGVFPEPTATPEPEVVEPAIGLKPASEVVVYYYESSKGYHVAPDCVGMSNAPAGTLAEAVAAGKKACGNCNPPAAELLGQPVLWLDEDKLCHTSDDCAAFKGKYTLIARDDALAQGLEACPDCGAADYLVPGTQLAGE